MIFEVLIVLQIIAFIFFGAGLIPFGRSDPEQSDGSLPTVNRVIFIFIAMTLFFSLAALSNSYDYVYCHINETNTISNTTQVSEGTCSHHTINSPGLAYINWGLAFVSLVVAIIIMIAGALEKKKLFYDR